MRGLRWPDAVLWVVLAVPLVPGAIGEPVELIAGLVLLTAAVLLFRRFPVWTLCALVAAAAVPALALVPTVTNPPWVWPFLAAGVFGFRAGRWAGDSVLVPLATVLLGGLPVSVLADGTARGGFGVLFGLYDWFLLVLIVLVVVLCPWLLGRYLRLRAEVAAAGLERAALLERARIARDMHDSLGHEWGLIALRAAALEVSPDLPERHRAAAGELRAGVAAATERLQEIIGVLGPRDERTDVAALVERAAAAGMDVEWTPAEPSPEAVERAVHRIVREGLTNAARHAPGAPVSVRVERLYASTTVTVANGPAVDTPGPPGGGNGLAALAEHARLLGGTLTTGQGDGGFTLVAELPHDARPANVGRPARRSLVRAARTPLLAGAAIAVLAMALYAAVGANNSLDPEVFEKIQLGTPRADVETRLPPFQILGDPERMLSDPPKGADCRYHWSREQTDEQLFFRLCFAADRLVHKEAVPRGAISGEAP
ncbi:sensor histidine kinase [Lentzea californiensis]|uniref:sensor histidine kinase n=1 Tax=Lentzea californiensis TaxID=438851 RepID=UPI0021652E92|nr:histidine kinase [Lentzea californiensis]MCR3750548.1 Signal transduction histidine kinase [Lentzea californiensis]